MPQNPNDFYTPANAVEVLANLIAQRGVFSALVSRNFQNDLLGGGMGGAPVSIKMPTTLIARDRDIDDVTSTIVLDNIVETRKTFNLDRVHTYSAVGLSEADLTLNLKDFGVQVLDPQAKAVVDSLEYKLTRKVLGVPVTGIGSGAGVHFDPANPIPYFTAIRKQLIDNGVAVAGLQMLVGTNVYAQLLDAGALTDVSQSGSTAALRDASVGKVRDFTVVEFPALPENEIVAFHRDAITLITRAPVVPQGASFGATIAEAGFNLRYLRDYDANHTQDRSIVSTFSGVGILPTYKVERNYDTRTVETTELENGGVLHLDTTVTAPAEPAA
jgi:hypothetical protein